MKYTLSAALAVLLLLAGCAAPGPKNPLQPATVESLAIERIDVSVADHASIRWGTAEEDYALSQDCERSSGVQSKGEDGQNQVVDPDAPTCDYEAVVSSPEAKQYLRDRLQREVQSAMERRFASGFDGSRPVEIQVVVNSVNVVSSGQAMLIGGAHSLSATFKVVDAVTGEVLATNGNLSTAAGYAPGGLIAAISEAASRDPVTRMSEGYAENAHSWLTEVDS